MSEGQSSSSVINKANRSSSAPHPTSQSSRSSPILAEVSDHTLKSSQEAMSSYITHLNVKTNRQLGDLRRYLEMEMRASQRFQKEVIRLKDSLEQKNQEVQ